MNVRLIMLLILSAVFGLSTALTFGWDNDQSADQSSLTRVSNSMPSEGKQNMEKLLGQFEKFAHPDATDLMIYRPKQLSETKIKQILDAPYQGMAGLREPWLPSDPDKIELIVTASSSTTLKNLSEMRTHKLFRSISKQLDAVKAKKENKSRKRFPTKINFFNQQFSGLVRFTEPTRWDVMQKWFREDSDFKGRLTGMRINDLEVMRCDENDSCIVIRLDERTFVIGSQAELESAVVETGPEAGSSPNAFISGCIDEVRQGDFDGEFYLAQRLPDSKLAVNHMAAMFLEPLIGGEKISEAKVSLSSGKKAILNAELLFASDGAAAKFVSKTQSLVSRRLAALEQEMKHSPVGGGFGWQIKAMIDIGKTIEMGNNDSTVHISLPRPGNLDELLQQYAKEVQAARDRIEKRMQTLNAPSKTDPRSGSEAFQSPKPIRSRAPKVKTRNRAPQPVRRRTSVVKTLPVVIAKSNIKAGTVLQPNHLRIEHWPAKLIPNDALRKKEAAIGRRTSQLSKGLPVISSHLE